MVYILDTTAERALIQAQLKYGSVVGVNWLKNMKSGEPGMNVYRIIFSKRV